MVFQALVNRENMEIMVFLATFVHINYIRQGAAVIPGVTLRLNNVLLNLSYMY